MATFARVNGYDNFAAGTLYTVAQLKAFSITVRNTGGTAVDISAQDGTAADQVIETLVKELQPLMYQAVDDASGVVNVIVDGHAVDAATLQLRIRNLGSTVGPDAIDVSGTTVTLGTSITVA